MTAQRHALLMIGIALVSVGAMSCTAAPATQADIEGAEANPYDLEEIGPEDDLVKKGVCEINSRWDYTGLVAIGYGDWGDWDTCIDFCPIGSFAYAVNVKSEGNQGSDDDTALNSISLHCYNRANGAFTGYVTGTEGSSGDWRAPAYTNPFNPTNPIKGGMMKIEGPQGGGDDTSANQIMISDFDDNGLVTVPSATSNGFWNHATTEKCSGNAAVCGIIVRVEPNQGGGDDTRLNGAKFACCSF